MALISGFNLIRALCALHAVLGYLLIKNPQRLANMNTIVVLGQAIGVQQALPSFWENRLGSSLAGVVMILFALTDLASIASIEETARDYWSPQGIIRCSFFACISGYIYTFRPGRYNIDNSTVEPLLNSLVFTWAFFEAIWWFWVHITLRDERGAAQQRIMQRRALQAELNNELKEE